jgi:hypothetical protein
MSLVIQELIRIQLKIYLYKMLVIYLLINKYNQILMEENLYQIKNE